MTIREHITLAPFTSLGVGGPVRYLIETEGPEELREARIFVHERGLPLRVLGAGTNVLVGDAGIEAVVVKLVGSACALTVDGEGAPLLVADAATPWDTLVDTAAAQGLWGIENLAGIPGSAAGALVQNIGAYGVELAGTFSYAETFDLTSGVEGRIESEGAALSYRTSLFKSRPDLIITNIALTLSREAQPRLTYPDLVRAREAGAPLTTPREIAAAVRAIRQEKFPRETEGGSAGSFFKNPVITAKKAQELRVRYPELPLYPLLEGTVKVPLAWLLDHVLGLAGYRYGLVRLFERQPLVIVTSKGARAADVEALAREVEQRVQDTFGISIEREVESFC